MEHLQSNGSTNIDELKQAPNSAHAVMDAIFDLACAEDVETAEIRLKRNGVPLPIFVVMAGPEHPKRKRFAFEKQRRVRKQLAKTGKMELGDPAEDELEESDLLADCTLSWRTEYKVKLEGGKDEMRSVPFVVFNGEQFDCNRQSVSRLISDNQRAWFRRALKEAFDDNEAFIKVSAND